MSELKRCPLCNSRGQLDRGTSWYLLGCVNNDCLLYKLDENLIDGIGHEEAVKKWNTRPLEDEARNKAIDECIEALEINRDQAYSGSEHYRWMQRALEVLEQLKGQSNE
jgi:hypothetical protein